ncbi:MAG: pseudouridylate synthase [Bacteroidota bacterium]
MIEVQKDKFFIPFNASIADYTLPVRFNYPFECNNPHPLCMLASAELQTYLSEQQEWNHNFGLGDDMKNPIVGKMFGVLIVETEQMEIGYLAAYSGKLAGGYHHPKFVPPVFDSLEDGSFLNKGMIELTRINQEIGILKKDKSAETIKKIDLLQQLRKANSVVLQNQLFDSYHFLNQAGKEKSLREIFKNNVNGNPPSGAGDCAGPKMLQYAFQHHMKPLAIAEFWWGQSPKSVFWKHGHFYPACREKCAPILLHMLEGIAIDEKKR